MESEASSHPPLTVVITLEALATSPLGCYGCSWNQTPSIDRLAAAGIVADRWVSPNDRPGALIHMWLSSAASMLTTSEIRDRSVLVSDDPHLEMPQDSFGFGASVQLVQDATQLTANSDDEFAFARLAATGVERIGDHSRLLWLHSSALRDCWDVPDAEVEETIDAEVERGEDEFEDETIGDDPAIPPLELPQTTTPPRIEVSSDHHPDTTFAWMQRYAAQVRGLDEMIEMVQRALPQFDLTIVIAGVSGFSLGENGWIAHRDGSLRSAHFRLPLVISRQGPLRIPNLLSAATFPQLLRRLLNQQPLFTPQQWCADEDAFSPMIVTESERATTAITTPEWFFVVDDDQTSNLCERLFLKPDDLADVNDVGRLRRDVIDQFRQRL